MAADKIENYKHTGIDRDLTEHPAIVDGINKMIRDGYSDDSIRRIIGGAATPEVIDHHRQMFEGTRSRRTDSELREMEEKRSAEREKRR